MPDLFDLSGRVALVTGAGRGVGAGIARTLAAQGAAVGANDVVASRAAEVAEAIERAGGRATAAPFDVTDPADVASGVEKVAAALGPIDVLVNNAGIPAEMRLARFRDMPPADWARYVDLNLYGVLHCTRAVIDGMCERGFGRIVTISSAAGQTGIALGVSVYGAGKGAAIAFMRHLALEVAGHGVTANTLALGLMADPDGRAAAAAPASAIPVGRLGTPEDVGAAVVFLASNEAGWITGQTLGVNGGSLTT